MTDPFNGIIPPIITPFGEEGAIDEAGFRCAPLDPPA